MTTTVSPTSKFQQITSCLCASTGNLAGAYLDPAGNGFQATLTASANAALSVDGVSPSVNDRVLVWQQTTGLQNGIYIVLDAGSGSTPWILQRSSDMQNINQIQAGYFVPIENGAVNGGDILIITLPLPGHLSVDSLIFTSVSRAAVSGATVTNNVLVAADTIGTIKDSGYKIIYGVTNAYGGGGTSFLYTAVGMVTTAKLVATILNSTNSVSLNSAAPGSDTIQAVFSANPGAATTLNYIAVVPVP